MNNKYFDRNRIWLSILAILLVLSMAACGAKDVMDPTVSDSEASSGAGGSASSGSESSGSATPSLPTIDNELLLDKQRRSLLHMKLAEPETMQSDLIAGIDRSSVFIDGDTTYFNSVMADGAVVRFEATNISICDEGIIMSPGCEIVSLDAVGKIYAYYAKYDSDTEYIDEANLHIGYAYTFSSEKISMQSADEIHKYTCAGGTFRQWDWWYTDAPVNVAHFQPNFVYFEYLYNIFAENPQEDYVLTSMTIAYNPNEKTTEMESAHLNNDFFAGYLDGERYNASMAESAEAWVNNDFYLCVKPKTGYTGMRYEDLIYFVPAEFYTVGDLKNEAGTVLDKETAVVHKGTTLDILMGDSKLVVELMVIDQFTGANTLNELAPFSYPSALGEKNVLVIPMVWADQPYMATDEQMSLCKKALGRVFDLDGNVTDYSDFNDSVFSLSEYFDIASYGKMSVSSFITDFYYTEMNFADWEHNQAELVHVDDMIQWVRKTYPNIDWSQFDQDKNGYIDSVIIINLGVGDVDGYTFASYGGAVHSIYSYVDEYVGTPRKPNVHTFVSINQRFLQDGATDSLIHEFSHNFGIKDYYDTYYAGIRPVGGYDMQADSVGDWNAYSKLAVGWMDPTIVTGLSKGESVEITIGSSALTDDVIIIPAAGSEYDGPFGEYIMIDLLSDDGVNAFDAAKYGLDGVVGVRISHVNATMEKRTYSVGVNGSGEAYVGWLHYTNDYKSDGMGRYNIEVIQSGKVNTFTTPGSFDTELSADDLFYAGDTFTVEEYDEFFYKGLMDSATEFGYTVEIVSIGTDASGAPTATIRVTAK